MIIEDYLESTYLKTYQEANLSEDENKKNIIHIVKEAIQYKFKVVIIRSQYIRLAKQLIHQQSSNLLVGTVIDFPNGDASTSKKVEEALLAIKLGADELDYVADYRSFKNRDFKKFDNDILLGTNLVKERNRVVKWIIETGALSQKEIKEITGRISMLIMKEFSTFVSNVFIKTSTGYHLGGGATVNNINIIKSFSGSLPIKASGGISDFIQCKNMIDAGATRIGTSKALDILLKK